MYTLILGLILLASFLWFNTSEKVKISDRPQWLEKLKAKTKLSKILASSILVLCLVIICFKQGFAAGIFAWIIYMMGMLCLIVLLFPYKTFRSAHIFLLLGFCLIFELAFTFFSTNI